MSFCCRNGVLITVLSVFCTAGCRGVGNSSWTVWKNHTRSSRCEACEQEGPDRWSDTWYAEKAQLPTGARQREHHGKLWPPFARPTGDKQEWSHRFHTAHYWPHPYNCQDLGYLRTVSASQVDNGWMTQTTLYDYHFDSETNALNQAGRLHLNWILNTIPEHRRYVWVQATEEPADSERRLAQVQQAAGELSANEKLPPIALRVAPTDGRPTNEINHIRELESGSMLPPHIEYTSPSAGTGGSGGGAGGGGTY